MARKQLNEKKDITFIVCDNDRRGSYAYAKLSNQTEQEAKEIFGRRVTNPFIIIDSSPQFGDIDELLKLWKERYG